MVKRPAVLIILAGLLALAIACGSDSDGGSSQAGSQPTQAPRPTATRTSGPSARIEPASGRPGTEVTITGTGWPAQASVGVGPLPGPGTTLQPYVTVTTDNDGFFVTRIRLDKTPAGEAIKVGRFDLAARSGSTEVRIPFEVVPPLPGGSGAGG